MQQCANHVADVYTVLFYHGKKVVSTRSVEMLSKGPFIRGYHAYMATWTPVEDEVLRVIPEPTNSVDRNAVAVMKEEHIVGHVPSLSHIS